MNDRPKMSRRSCLRTAALGAAAACGAPLAPAAAPPAPLERALGRLPPYFTPQGEFQDVPFNGLCSQALPGPSRRLCCPVRRNRPLPPTHRSRSQGR